jgi:hypothetical protein
MALASEDGPASFTSEEHLRDCSDHRDDCYGDKAVLHCLVSLLLLLEKTFHKDAVNRIGHNDRVMTHPVIRNGVRRQNTEVSLRILACRIIDAARCE